MYLFGLEGSGFIISLALTLLISGAIMFYCLKRFSIIENSIVEQGRILQSFIIRSQNGELTTGVGLANNEAIKAAKEQNINLKSERIEVSDNSEYSTSDSEESTCLEFVADNSGQDISLKDTDISNLETANISTTINLVDSVNLVDSGNFDHLVNSTESIKIISVNNDFDEPPKYSDSISDDTSESDDLLSSLVIDSDSININLHTDNTEKKSYSKLKVGELRNIVLNSGLVDDLDAVNKIKKDDLIKMLHKN